MQTTHLCVISTHHPHIIATCTCEDLYVTTLREKESNLHNFCISTPILTLETTFFMVQNRSLAIHRSHRTAKNV